MRPPIEKKQFAHFDWPLFGCALLILLMGLLNLHSATFNLPVARFFSAQVGWVGLGLALALLVMLVDYRLLAHLAYPIYVVILILLAIVLFKGKAALGAQRWISLGPLSIQPSELSKLAVVFCLAKYFHTRREKEQLGFAGLLWPALLTGVPFLLILKQPDLGTGLVVASVAISLILFFGVKLRVIVIALLIAGASVPLVWKYALHGYQKDRVITFLAPEKFSQGKGYQVIQSMIAIGAGELTGKGYLKGSQSKLQFLPKQYTDFVFSNFAEEFGFLGSAFLLFLFASLALLCLNVSFTAKETFGMFLAFGLTAMISCQAVINLAMESGALPVVGITLPLFSYGGTSLLTTMMAIGLLMNISMRRYIF
jgi:rod shape determining protein RodA